MIHFPPARNVQLLVFALLGFLLVLPRAIAASYEIAGSISNANPPGGTLAAPLYVIDSDATNAAAGYDRDAIPASANLFFSRATDVSSGSDFFRLHAQLIDSNNQEVTLANADAAGGNYVTSTSFQVNLSAFLPILLRTENLSLQPAQNLGGGKSFTIRYKLQRNTNVGNVGGFPLYMWQDVDTVSSAAFTVVHFNDTPENSANFMTRCYPTGEPTWLKDYLITTGSTTPARSFQVQVPYLLARYDLSGSSRLMSFRLTATLVDDADAEIPLENSGVTTVSGFSSFTATAYTSGAPNAPAVYTGNLTGSFRPTSQLDPRNRSYRIKVRIEHVESTTPIITYLDGGESPLTTTGRRLLHFNGNLRFGPAVGGLQTQFSAISNTPAVGTLGAGYVNTSLNVTSGTIPSFLNYTFGDGSALSVQLTSSGDAVVTAGSQPVVVSGGGDVTATYGGVTVSYPGTFLSQSGVTAGSQVIHLPQGLSYAPNRAAARNRYQATITIPGADNLTNQFRQTSTISLPLGADAWVFDESRPLLYQVSHFDFKPDGTSQFTAADSEWIHQAAYEQLETQQASGQHKSRDMAVRLSNDGYLRYADVLPASTLAFATAADGSIRTKFAECSFGAGAFFSHFPYNTKVNWNGGSMKISDGYVQQGAALTDAAAVAISYDGACTEEGCSPPGGAATNVAIEPTDKSLKLTADGGLWSTGNLAAPQRLNWGIRADATHSHRTDVFSKGEALFCGYQSYASENPLHTPGGAFSALAGPLGPAVITLAGYDPSHHATPVYPESQPYTDGAGAYPGITFTVDDTTFTGGSRLADLVHDYSYRLQEAVSKYYIRKSGLSGRHVAAQGDFDSSVKLYGYDFTVDLFQLTFLSNVNRKSWFNGSVSVGSYSNFKQAFLGMTLTCTAGLSDAEIDPDDIGKKPLDYWDGSFSPLTMRFAPQEGAPCGSDRTLVIGLTSGAANIDTPLSGSLGFKPNGNIATLSDNLEGTDSRLGLPGTLPMAGPGSESYPLIPSTKLYFNNPETANAPGTGYVSFAASCPVPFFQDIKLHLMTSANSGVPADLYATGGWTSAGETFFTNSQFDPNHAGFPSVITPNEYRDPTKQSIYSPRAVQSLFGIVNLDYPMQWSPTGRYFQSFPKEPENLLVVKIKHQVDYLSAENAEISFGAQYDGLPKINLASAAIDLADGETGAVKAMVDAAGQEVTDTLNQGVDEVGKLVNDTMEDLLDAAIDEIDQQVLNPLYTQVNASYSTSVSAGNTYNQWANTAGTGLQEQFDDYLDGVSAPINGSVKSRLNQLSDATAQASSVVVRITSALDRGILAIDSVTGQIQTFRDNSNPDHVVVALSAPSGFSAAEAFSGILREVNGPGGEPERQIVQSLVRRLIAELAPPELASVVGPLLEDASAEANAELATLLTQFDPTLDRVSEVLNELRTVLSTAKTQFNDPAKILGDIQNIVTAANSDIDAINVAIRASGQSFISRIATSANYSPTTVLGSRGDLMAEFSREEFRALLRAELRDRLLAAPFISQIQYLLRQQVAQVDDSMHSAIDSAFGEVNRMCKELLREFLGPIDEAINGMLGSVTDYVGAGEVDGYAHIQGDTLRRLRLDAKLQLKVPDEMNLKGFLEINCYDSTTTTGGSSCLAPGEQVVEVKGGALDVPLDWISPDMRADVNLWFSMKTAPTVSPYGIGGGIKMTGGELNFQSIKVTAFESSVGIGASECFFAGTASMEVSSYQASGGVFFGKTCSIEPLMIVDPDVASVLGTPPFTGAYVYGEVWIPISEVILGIPASCMFRISAGVGAGAFYFVEGPTYGGKMLLGLSGEALCVVSISGDVKMAGVMSGGSMRFTGRGTLKGKAGYCPFCVKFKESARITYQDGSWDVDY